MAHLGIPLLDELPEFQRGVLDSLRQTLETGTVMVASAAANVGYPSRTKRIAATTPCRCGYLGDASGACSRTPKCAADYQARLSGPLLDQIELQVDVAAAGRNQRAYRRASAAARAIQTARYTGHTACTNA